MCSASGSGGSGKDFVELCEEATGKSKKYCKKQLDCTTCGFEGYPKAICPRSCQNLGWQFHTGNCLVGVNGANFPGSK
eukprot:CAMPEP_0118632436 /NCGR_PEP_ID=MMETSP0785-20121206/446_1 /TAXON_ID=91992 /ORGANISM="Bolidomonas pacifica, Strain CCMP 1866" /LENGTH=77 /DNA_ID=CAMNT_0006523211 /DNA_START=553 /DNA_END=783 /DNA_ORIENTATION=-